LFADNNGGYIKFIIQKKIGVKFMQVCFLSSAILVDWSATAAWIALAVAIISPIITTIITNSHQSKLKRLEIVEKRGLEIIESYVSNAARATRTFGVSENYRYSYYQIFLFAPKSIHNEIEELNSLIITCNATSFPDEQKCQILLTKICKELYYNKL